MNERKEEMGIRWGGAESRSMKEGAVTSEEGK